MFDFPLPPLITGGYPFTFEGDAVHWDVPSSSDSSDLYRSKPSHGGGNIHLATRSKKTIFMAHRVHGSQGY